MIWNKQEIIDFLDTQKEDALFFIDKEESRASKTRQQEKTYYKLMTDISKHLWYNVDEVKMYLLSWCFWTKKLKLSKTEIEIPVISRTRDFTKEQWIFFIDTLLKFIELKKIPITLTTQDVKNLYDNYT